MSCMLDVAFFICSRAFAVYFVFTIFSAHFSLFFSQLLLHVCALVCLVGMDFCLSLVAMSISLEMTSSPDILMCGMRDRRRA